MDSRDTDGVAQAGVARADIAHDDPAALYARFVAHLAEHEIEFEPRDAGVIVALGQGSVTVVAGPDRLTAQLESADDGDLAMMREGVSTLMDMLAQGPVTIRWSGLPEEGETFANFREIELVAKTRITPLVRRLTFAGDDLARFASPDDLHVRLFLPPAGVARPEWPRPGPDGRMLWPPEDRRPATRYYTVRSVDIAKGLIDIDFVLHADVGPGAAFAETAEPGAVLGMMGPLGRTTGAASWYLLAGDETALPAIARIAENLPRDAHGAILVEIAGPGEEIALAAPPGVSVRWLHRNGAAAGLPDRLVPAVRDTAWPADSDVFFWAGCEYELARTLRQHVTKERGLRRDRCLVVGYWSRAQA